MTVYIIGEAGSVHDGSLGNALRLVEEIAAAGANAAKFQDHLGERLKGIPPWARNLGESRDAYLKRTQFTDEGWLRIRECCTRVGVDLVVSPFSVEAVERLERIGVDAYKVASGQVTNLGMLEAIAKTGKRAFLSSGMSSEVEHDAAERTLAVNGGNYEIMHCTSEYPCPPERVGLNIIREWTPCGLSDHTLGMAASLAAITLGATVIERHVTFHRGMHGTDARHSLTLEEFGAFVREVRTLEVMLASPVDKDALAKTEAMREMREAFLE